MTWRAAIIAAVLAGHGAACAATPAVTPHATRADAAACADADARADAHWARRAHEREARAALAAWRNAAARCPAAPRRFLALARGAQFVAEGHLAVRGDKGDAYVALLDAGVRDAEAGLAALSPRWAELRATGVPRVDALAVLDARAAPLLYWLAQDQILAAAARGTWATIEVYQEVRALMERVADADPGYWYGGADRFLGAFFAAAPPVAGGDLALAREHLDAAVARAPDFHENRLVYAVMYAGPVGDRALYRGLLEAIVAAPPSRDPDIAVEQAITQEKARRLL